MADGLQFSLTGLDSLLGKLEAVKQETKFKGGRSALRKGAQVLQQQAIGNAERLNDPATAEEIAKNVVVRWSNRRFKRTGDLMFRVGILGGARATGKAAEKTARRRKRKGQRSLGELGEIEGAGKANPGGDTFYWRFLEYGTSRSPAKPFMRPVVDQAGQKAVDEFLTQYGRAIDRAVRRAAKRGTTA